MIPKVNKGLGFKDREDIPGILLPVTGPFFAPMASSAEQLTFSVV